MKFQNQLLNYSEEPPKDFEVEMKILYRSHTGYDVNDFYKDSKISGSVDVLKARGLLNEAGRINFKADGVLGIYCKLAEDHQKRLSV